MQSTVRYESIPVTGCASFVDSKCLPVINDRSIDLTDSCRCSACAGRLKALLLSRLFRTCCHEPSLELTCHQARRRIVLVMMQKAAAVAKTQQSTCPAEIQVMPTSSVSFETLKSGWLGNGDLPRQVLDAWMREARHSNSHDFRLFPPLSLPVTSTPSSILTMNNAEPTDNRVSCCAFPLRPAQLCTWTGIPKTSTRSQTTFLAVAAAGPTAHSELILADSWRR